MPATAPLPPPLTVERTTDHGNPVCDLVFGELFVAPDGVPRLVAFRRRATGDALGMAVLAVLAERDALQARVQELEAELGERQKKRFVRKEG